MLPYKRALKKGMLNCMHCRIWSTDAKVRPTCRLSPLCWQGQFAKFRMAD